MDRWNLIAACFTCSFAFLLENRSRQSELVMYMIPRLFESIYRILVNRGLAKTVKNGEVLVFAICMALIMYCYQNKQEHIKPGYLNMLKRFFGTNW